ncbi:hypothetical protein C1645_875936 [Glomus cerebriforme]|uniref:Uncharacterized protein n=1 Tax=Glomus cerebriforme TaxID=658196 RepID=A0A397T6M3_9GLOM|nr:hypothetical protein C1645_875936 [Glomus cerebriforme]
MYTPTTYSNNILYDSENHCLMPFLHIILVSPMTLHAMSKSSNDASYNPTMPNDASYDNNSPSSSNGFPHLIYSILLSFLNRIFQNYHYANNQFRYASLR